MDNEGDLSMITGLTILGANVVITAVGLMF